MNPKFLTALAAVSICGAAQAAGPGFLGNMDNSTVAIENTIVGDDVSFTDNYTFTVSDTAFADGSVAKLRLNPFPQIPGPEWNLMFDEISFVDVASNTVLGSDTNGFDGWSLTATLPDAGLYRLVVEGTTSGNFGGKYEGELSVALIPEPSTYALMLAGLGVVGFLAKRRKPL